jgi:hypothetical protein
MTQESAPQVDVGGFAAAINSRLAVESRIARAISLAWFGGGVAIACCLSGLGVFAALYGYSYTISVRSAAEQTAKALAEAVQRTQLKTTVSGTMSLATNSELRLAPGQTVKLEEGTTVKLAPNSSVRVIGNLKYDIPQPSTPQLGLNARDKNNELPFTSYTIFRSVPYASGEVVTGWDFQLTDRQRPKLQFCYYSFDVDKGRSIKHTIAFDGVPMRSSALDKIDFEGALANCIWFSGQ